MALNTSGLESDLQSLFSEPASGYDGVANQWGDAIESYVQNITPPSSTVTAAVEVLKDSLSAAFQSGQLDGTGTVTATALELAFSTFAATIGVGMAPGFVATPPPSSVGWLAALSEVPPPSTHAEAADKYSTLIDVWMRTGTAVPSSGGSTVNWA